MRIGTYDSGGSGRGSGHKVQPPRNDSTEKQLDSTRRALWPLQEQYRTSVCGMRS